MKKYLLLIVISPILVFLDLWTKYLIVIKMPWGSKQIIWENFFDLVHVTNKGSAFGMMANLPDPWREIFFACVSLVAFILLLRLYHQGKSFAMRFSISLVLGGALGNIIDRTYRGAVVDFLSFHWHNKIAQFNLFGSDYNIPLTWPAFNVADICISIGVVLLMISMYHEEKSEAKKQDISPAS